MLYTRIVTPVLVGAIGAIAKDPISADVEFVPRLQTTLGDELNSLWKVTGISTYEFADTAVASVWPICILLFSLPPDTF